mgnify:FL=1
MNARDAKRLAKLCERKDDEERDFVAYLRANHVDRQYLLHAEQLAQLEHDIQMGLRSDGVETVALAGVAVEQNASRVMRDAWHFRRLRRKFLLTYVPSRRTK